MKKNKQVYSMADLISFGSYLLSQEREKLKQTSGWNPREVSYADIENWKHLKDNIKNQ